MAKITPSNAYYFYHYDGLGSTVAITDENAQIVNSYAYSPYGLVGGQETIPNPFKYVGRFGVMDEGNGLYYMRARYYDPEVGRFINKDPIGYAGGDTNLYAYCLNNPINLVDPWGLILDSTTIKFIIEELDKPQYKPKRQTQDKQDDIITYSFSVRHVRSLSGINSVAQGKARASYPGQLPIKTLTTVGLTMGFGARSIWVGGISPVLRVWRGGPLGPIIIGPEEIYSPFPAPAEAATINGEEPTACQ